ncbi:inorganic pyrophosphatase [Metarhizium rileyi]|uniref:Inorganic pyrophosphatase n=1 Tax=Metarhizium rileyi (strain RCEF 4871) TaxID=1649241 RepID=A0A167I473_METRR|nr:inorganic pyrophosphatase [Metarhizium rileyi RCEF 4871]
MAPEVTYAVHKIGVPNTLGHKVYIEQQVHQKVVNEGREESVKLSSKLISPFHDIPLYADKENGILNMIVEIPRWCNAKLEISKNQELNPIVQDRDKDSGGPRFVRNCFPHKGYLWNYGAFPQTWEDPAYDDPNTAAFGDNDPLDVCEIGEHIGYTGQVKQVKVLGIMALLDEGETDWKVIVIDVNDALAPELQAVEDIETKLPGLLRATNEWFRIYKIPDKKPENQFAFTGETKNKDFAFRIIDECHAAWNRLIDGKTEPRQGMTEKAADKIKTTNTTLVGRGNYRATPPEVKPHEELPPAKVDINCDKWFFISGNSA